MISVGLTIQDPVSMIGKGKVSTLSMHPVKIKCSNQKYLTARTQSLNLLPQVQELIKQLHQLKKPRMNILNKQLMDNLLGKSLDLSLLRLTEENSGSTKVKLLTPVRLSLRYQVQELIITKRRRMMSEIELSMRKLNIHHSVQVMIGHATRKLKLQIPVLEPTSTFITQPIARSKLLT